MKWQNKGHEFDKKAEELLKNPEKFRHIYIFGAGLIGADLIPMMRAYGILDGFIDNDIQKQHSGYRGFPVYSIEEYKNMQGGFIVIAASEQNIPDIAGQLEKLQLSEGSDFVSHIKFCNEIFPIVSVYLFHKVFVNTAQISLTERCSLKCRKCAHGCAAVDNAKAEDLAFGQACKSADAFFSKVDFIYEFVLIGGEPLLYRQLPEIIHYIGKKYRKQIGIFSITTNGTILPNEKVLQACKDHQVLFRISNYSMAMPRLREMYQKLTDLLDKNAIAYVLGKEEREWMDYGFEYVDRGEDAKELTRVFDACKTLCREVRGNRYYFCVMARSVSENMGFGVGMDDYLDLDSLTGEDYQRVFLEFDLGYSEKGYLDMCSHCHGADTVDYPIPVAEQLEIYGEHQNGESDN